MWISDRVRARIGAARPMREIEAIALAGTLAFLPELYWGRQGVWIEPHPGWIGVLILAARYGSGGFFVGLAASMAATGLASALADAGIAAITRRSGSLPDLLALGACLIVSWIASRQIRRQAELQEGLDTLRARLLEAEATAQSLHNVVRVLRERNDRASASLSFLRDIAARLEGNDPVAAAEAAAELALVRTGARAAAVGVGMGHFQRLLAVRSVGGPGPQPHLKLLEADLSAPIQVGRERVGMIAVWDLPRSAPREPTLRDLSVIASWCGPALATARDPDGTEGRSLEAIA